MKLITVIFLLLSSQIWVAEARMYQWTDPNTGTAYLSGDPPTWYRTPQDGPRILVFQQGELVDDTGQRASLQRQKVLRAEALKEQEVRKLVEEKQRADAARLAAEKAIRDEEQALPKQGEDERSRTEYYLSVLKALDELEQGKQAPQP